LSFDATAGPIDMQFVLQALRELLVQNELLDPMFLHAPIDELLVDTPILQLCKSDTLSDVVLLLALVALVVGIVLVVHVPLSLVADALFIDSLVLLLALVALAVALADGCFDVGSIDLDLRAANLDRDLFATVDLDFYII